MKKYICFLCMFFLSCAPALADNTQGLEDCDEFKGEYTCYYEYNGDKYDHEDEAEFEALVETARDIKEREDNFLRSYGVEPNP